MTNETLYQLIRRRFIDGQYIDQPQEPGSYQQLFRKCLRMNEICEKYHVPCTYFIAACDRVEFV